MCRRLIFLSSLVLVLGLVGYASGGYTASNPSPANGAECVDRNTALTWSPGDGAMAHDVYFGTDYNNVNNATVGSPMGVYKGRQVSTTYSPGTLGDCTTYYWRIDEVNVPIIVKGDVWHFTTDGNSCCHCISPPSNMAAWWPLDETVGNTSEDRVWDNNGTWMNSPTPITAGMVNGALSFDGVNDYVNVPDAPELNFGTGDFSIDAWIRTDSNDTYEVFVDKRIYNNAIGYEFLLYHGKLTFGLGAPNGWTSYWNPTSSDLNDGEWHFVAVTVNRDEPNGGKLYCDGEIIHTFNPTNRAGNITNSADLWIGRHHPVDIYDYNMWFDGEIDEVELFNRALDVNEIRAIYTAGSDGKCKCEPGLTYKDDIKWSQPPVEDETGCINGWDEVSIIDSNNNCWNCPAQLHGDADCDGHVGSSDAAILAAAYGTHYGEPNYNPCADFDRDDDVDMLDQGIMAANWGNYPGDSPLARPIVADDWVCMDDRPIKDIHWWGSFKGWTGDVPPNDKPKAFCLGIWTDVPDPNKSDPNNFSHPGRLVWQKVCSCYTWSYAGCDIDPRGIDQNETCFMFDQLLSQDEWFHQDPNADPNDGKGTVYWLSIAAVHDGNTPAYPWGWKTRPHFYNDDAVRIADVNGILWPLSIGSTWVSGEPIKYPAGTSWDLAFVLTTNRKYAPRRGYWPSQSPSSDATPLSQVDFDGDLIVNFKDFAVMAEEWLTEGQVWPEWDLP